MGNLSISINSQNYQQSLELRQVKEGTSLEEAKNVLEAEKDGLDTVGATIEGVDYLISGKGIKGEVGDQITIEGDAVGTVAFIEQEANTFGEGWKKGVNTPMGGLQHSVAGGPFMAMAGLVGGAVSIGRGMTANTEVLEKVTQGPVITHEVIQNAIKAFESMFDW